MGRVSVTEVVTQSSEDPSSPAVNVLNDSRHLVWSADPGVEAVIVLQLEKVRTLKIPTSLQLNTTRHS